MTETKLATEADEPVPAYEPVHAPSAQLEHYSKTLGIPMQPLAPTDLVLAEQYATLTPDQKVFLRNVCAEANQRLAAAEPTDAPVIPTAEALALMWAVLADYVILVLLILVVCVVAKSVGFALVVTTDDIRWPMVGFLCVHGVFFMAGLFVFHTKRSHRMQEILGACSAASVAMICEHSRLVVQNE